MFIVASSQNHIKSAVGYKSVSEISHIAALMLRFLSRQVDFCAVIITMMSLADLIQQIHMRLNDMTLFCNIIVQNIYSQLLADKTEVKTLNVVRMKIPMQLWNPVFDKVVRSILLTHLPPLQPLGQNRLKPREGCVLTPATNYVQPQLSARLPPFPQILLKD